MCRKTIYDARNEFSALVKLAESGEPVEITRHDKPVAVIISWEEYEKRQPKQSFVEWLEEFKAKYADDLDDEGIPLPPKEYPDEEYNKKIARMWED